MKDVCVYDDTYDLIMSMDLDSKVNLPFNHSFAMRLFCLVEDFAHLIDEYDYVEKK